MREYFVWGTYAQRSFCWSYRPEHPEGHFLWNNDYAFTSLDKDDQSLLACLLKAFPERPDPVELEKVLNAIRLGHRDLSRKKNYLINRLDRALQDLLGLKPPTLEKFKARDRLLLDYTRSQTPQFMEGVLHQIWSPQGLDEISLLHFQLVCLGQWRTAGRLFQHHLQFSERATSIEQAQRLQLYECLREGQLDTLKTSQFQGLLDWLLQLRPHPEKPLSLPAQTLVRKIDLMLEQLLNRFLRENPQLLYLKMDLLAEPVSLTPEHLQMQLARKLLTLDRVPMMQNAAEDAQHRAFHAKFALNYLGKPCEEPSWNQLLISPQEICEIERQAHSVWIITSHFIYDNNPPWKTFTDMQHNNMLTQTRYVYFYPPDLDYHRKAMLDKIYFLYADNLPLFVPVPELDTVFRFIASEIALYDAEDPDSPWHQAYDLDVFDSMVAYHGPADSFPTVHQRIPTRRMMRLIEWCQAQMASRRLYV